MKVSLKQLEEEIKYEPPTEHFPGIRNVDARLMKLLREKKEQKSLTWERMFTEMALDWLKKK